MEIAMEALGKSNSKLTDLAYLKNTASFKSAYEYLKQKDIVKEIPTIEINGKLHDEFPNRKFLEKQFASFLITRKEK